MLELSNAAGVPMKTLLRLEVAQWDQMGAQGTPETSTGSEQKACGLSSMWLVSMCHYWEICTSLTERWNA